MILWVFPQVEESYGHDTGLFVNLGLIFPDHQFSPVSMGETVSMNNCLDYFLERKILIIDFQRTYKDKCFKQISKKPEIKAGLHSTTVEKMD